MAYNLFLDDQFTPYEIADITPEEKNRERYRRYKWIIVKTYQEFVEIILKKGLPGIVSFDHDLAPEHWDILYSDENWFKQDDAIIVDYDKFETKTGYHAAEWLLEYCAKNRLNNPTMLVHSQNKIGKRNIENLIL